MFNDFYGIKFPQVKDEGQDLYATEDADKKLEELEKAFRIFPLSWDSLQTKWMKHHHDMNWDEMIGSDIRQSDITWYNS